MGGGAKAPPAPPSARALDRVIGIREITVTLMTGVT